MGKATDNGQPTRRLTLADAYRDAQERLHEAVSRVSASEPSASVEITRNAKGEVQFSVKVFAPANAEPAEVEAATARAYDQATQSFAALNTLHPFGG